MSEASRVHIFGIRHHGPGSARSVRRALEHIQPEIILVEGPPDAHSVLPLLASPQMRPPVALLVYVPEAPRRSVYYPFAIFSPEWQAMHFGLTQDIPIRFMDLPQAHQLGEETEDAPAAGENGPEPAAAALDPFRQDPIRSLAEAAGYSESERWWEHMVEQRQEATDLFAGIQEAMTALRQAAGPEMDRREALREAFMRQTIRQALADGYHSIAVVCGAWHGPALTDLPPAHKDAALLAGLPRAKVAATWVPWTNGRLTSAGGYGAGIESPGWYHHLWTHPDSIVTRWMTHVAHLLREQDLDASPASVIEAVRLAETLAALRGRPLPGLPEMNEAVQTVLCFGSDVPLRLIADKMIVGEALGEVPLETPSVPLQQDLERQQRRVRLPPEASERVLDLDLRTPNDLERSHLLHRLGLLGIEWGRPERSGGGKGTFHERWRLRWQPEFAVGVIEAALWGNTVLDAAEATARRQAAVAPDLPALTRLLDHVLLAELPNAAQSLMERLEAEAALASDVAHLMDALPPLVNVMRYGNVRRTDAGLVQHVVHGLVTRIAIGLPGACASLNDEAAAVLFERLLAVHNALTLLQDDALLTQWQQSLRQMVDRESLHGLLAGRCCRLLLERGNLDPSEAARRMGLALSPAGRPDRAAAWVEGFLKGSGQFLLHDEALWAMLDGWVVSLSEEIFVTLLPLLRRTFATFTEPERRQMGRRAKDGPATPSPTSSSDTEGDIARAEAVLPLIAQLLGLSTPQKNDKIKAGSP